MTSFGATENYQTESCQNNEGFVSYKLKVEISIIKKEQMNGEMAHKSVFYRRVWDRR